MTDREERIEEIKIYREAARHYFNTRSNLTYINILGCGAVAVLFAKNLLDSPNGCYFSTIEDYYWLYVAGLLVVIALAVWATAMCNLLSNSFYSYLLMVRELEDDLRIRYPKSKSWAVTFEFLSKEAQEDIHGPALRGNVWNLANAFLAVCGIYVLTVISEVAHVGFIFYFSGVIYILIVAVVMFLSFKEIPWMIASWLIVVGFSVMPLVAGPGQAQAMSHLGVFALSPSHGAYAQVCQNNEQSTGNKTEPAQKASPRTLHPKTRFD